MDCACGAFPATVCWRRVGQDGQLKCHGINFILLHSLFKGHHNLTQIFNAIETRGRLEQDALEHGWDVPESEEDIHNPSYK